MGLSVEIVERGILAFGGATVFGDGVCRFISDLVVLNRRFGGFLLERGDYGILV